MVNKKLKKILLTKPGYQKKSADWLFINTDVFYKSGISLIDMYKTLTDTLASIRKDSIPTVKKLEEKYSKAVTKVSKSKIVLPTTKVGEVFKIIKKPINFKRLFFDIETSYNVVSSWRIGNKISITHDNIIKERAVICVCWKWEGDTKVHSLEWNNGDDKQLLIDFIKVLNQAEEIVGHNSDKFDLKWLRTRCAFHGVEMFPTYQTLDTLKLARTGFNFNSNRLDYLGKFFGFGGKLDTGGFKLWQRIIMDNCSKSMKQMVDYCKQDVVLLEQVYGKLQPYSLAKTHVGVVIGESKCSCPNCGSENSISNGKRTSAAGVVKKMMKCGDCNKYYQIALTTWNKFNELNMKAKV